MRHRVYGKHLNRDKNQRTALFRGLVRSLILAESIITTKTKAKAIKGLVDQLITKARENTEASRRVIYSNIPQKQVSKKLLEDIAPWYKERNSGFTQLVKLGRRAGDGAMLVRMNLIKEEPKEPEVETSDSSDASGPSGSAKKQVAKKSAKTKGEDK